MATDPFNLAAVALAWIAAALFVFAMLGDPLVQRIRRLRGIARKRCPRCFYDLTHTAPNENNRITCSECGRTIKRERHLYKGRKRYALAGFALILLLAAHAVRITPDVRERGWVAAVPTFALILYLPHYDTEHSDRIMHRPRTITAPLDLPLIDQAYLDFRHVRLRDEQSIGRFTERWLVRRCMKGDRTRRPLSKPWKERYGSVLHAMFSHADREQAHWRAAIAMIDIKIETRDAWPVGVPIWVDITIDRWEGTGSHRIRATPVTEGLEPIATQEQTPLMNVNYGNFWRMWQTRLGTPPSTAGPLVYDVLIDYGGSPMYETHAWREVGATTWRPHITIEGTIEDYVQPVHSAEIDEAIADLFSPTLQINLGSTVGYVSLVDGRAMSLAGERLARIGAITLGLEVHALRDGEVVARGEVWYRITSRERDGEVRWSHRPMGVRISVDVDEDLVELDQKEIESGSWSLRVIGSPTVALRDFDATHYWAGETELPLTVTARRPWAPSSRREDS